MLTREHICVNIWNLNEQEVSSLKRVKFWVAVYVLHKGWVAGHPPSVPPPSCLRGAIGVRSNRWDI